MLPILAIVGRPNVGKSTLFNRLTRSRDALVANTPGVTRDRQYGNGEFDRQHYIVIDTGGIGEDETGIFSHMAEQTQIAIQEADAILLLVDGRSGMNATDQEIGRQLRELNKTIFLIVNKTDGVDPIIACADFFTLGLGEPIAIAAAHARGVTQMLQHIFTRLPSPADDTAQIAAQKGIQLAIIGKPNVGKSTLVNRMLGEERVVVYDQPGTTKDSIFIPFERRGQQYTLIDTAGVRRRRKITDVVEKFSVIKSLQAIEASNVVLFLIDAREGVADQDLSLLDFVIDAGKALVIAVNKWDGLDDYIRGQVKYELDRRLVFAEFADCHFISALHGTGVGNLFRSVEAAYQSATRKLATPELTRILQAATQAHPPPLSQGRRIKLRYAHAGGQNPPLIIIHGSQAKKTPTSYRRYLSNTFRKKLKLVGTPVLIDFKDAENPFAGRKNKLTDRQILKKKRLMKYVKKKSRQ